MTTATIKLFLPYGDPKRLRTAEISNWTGKAVVAPRTELEYLLARPEATKPGVYILTGRAPGAALHLVVATWSAPAQALAPGVLIHTTWALLLLALHLDARRALSMARTFK